MKTITHKITTMIDVATLNHPLEQCIFFDIETTGLSPRASSLYLIGILTYDAPSKQWEITQWFANKYRDEKIMIELFLEKLEHYHFLYHFNGKTFDIPYILHKCEKYHINRTEHAETILRDTTGDLSIDLLSNIRPLKKLLGIQKAGQIDLERWIGLNREDTYNGGELIPIYSQYMQDQLLHPEHAEKLEHFLLLHNHDDMQGMLTVSNILNYKHLFEVTDRIVQQLQITEISQKEAAPTPCLRLHFSHGANLPKPISVSGHYPASKTETSVNNFPESCTWQLKAQSGTLEIPMIQTELKYFLPNPKDYYYLPAEDQAIHKSVAEFVEPSHRQKATAATCYLRKQGQFLPSLLPYKATKESADKSQIPLFFHIYRDKLSFYHIPQSLDSKDPFWKEYLIHELRALKTYA